MNDNTEKHHVLLVEDDNEIASIVSMNLEDNGLEVSHVADGRMGLKEALTGKFSLIILDIMLPELDGISVCKKIRETDPLTPIMMLTARAEEIDRILGLELGADDYMVKPFSLRELLARVRALLRRFQAGLRSVEEGNISPGSLRSSEAKTPALSKIGDLVIDFNKRKVILANKEIELTVKEFELLGLFFRNPGRAYSRTDLLNLVWGYQFEGYEHTVNTHISRLRNKIETDPAHPKYLKTVWGIGYRFAEGGEF